MPGRAPRLCPAVVVGVLLAAVARCGVSQAPAFQFQDDGCTPNGTGVPALTSTPGSQPCRAPREGLRTNLVAVLAGVAQRDALDMQQQAQRDFRLGHPDSALYVLHIPKTGGTSFARYLWKHYFSLLRMPVHTICRLYPREQKTSCGTGKGRNASHTDFVREASQLRLLEGHYTYGVHAHLRPRAHAVRYITFLRDPAARFLSQWRYAFYRHHGLDLLRYVHRPGSTFCNLQVALLSGVGSGHHLSVQQLWRGQPGGALPISLCPPYRKEHWRLLELAKAHLSSRTFMLAMLLERMGESLCLLRSLIHGPGFTVRALCGKAFPHIVEKRPQPPAAAVQVKAHGAEVDQANLLDKHLYTHAAQLFQQKLARFPTCRGATLAPGDVFRSPHCDQGLRPTA